jgi:hypothetical protein
MGYMVRPLTGDEIHRLATAPLPRIVTVFTPHGASYGPKKAGPVTLEDQAWADRAQQTRESK